MFIVQLKYNGKIFSVTSDGQSAHKSICTHGISTENILYLHTWEKVFVDKTTRWSQTKMCAIYTQRRGVAAHQGEVLAELHPINNVKRL